MDLYFDVNHLLYVIAGCVYVSFVLYAEKLERIDRVRYGWINKIIFCAFIVLLIMAVLYRVSWLMPEDSRIHVTIGAVALGAMIIYLNWLRLVSLVLYVWDLETTDARYERLNKSVPYAFLGLLLVIAVQSNSLWILPENLKTPVLLAAIAFGAATLFLHRVGQFSFIHNKKMFKEIYEAGYDGIYKSISYAFYGLLVVTVLYYLPWIVLEGLKGPIMDAAIFFGALTFYLNRVQLISYVLYVRDLETTDVRYERLNKSVSYAFLGLLLVVAVQSNLSLLPESLKTPIILAAIGFGAAALYLHRVGLVSFIMHPRKFEKNEVKYEGINESISYVFYGLMIVVVLYYLPWTVLEELKIQIMVVAVALGTLTFYLNRDKLGEVEEEARQEKEGEKRREKEFAGKYPRIDRVWGVRGVVRWMFKEGWWYSFGLIGVTLICASLYFYRLGNYGFQMDEFYHAGVVQTYIEEGKLFYIEDSYYGRSKVTSLISIASYYLLSIFPFDLSLEFKLRFIIGLFGIINIMLIYLIGKEISSKKIALLASAFVGTETYIMYFATYLRFYTISIFVILLLIYLNLKLKNKNILLISAIFSFFCYYYLVEYFLFIAIFFLGLYILNILEDIKKIKKNKTYAAFLLLTISLFFYQFINILVRRFESNPTYNLVSWNLNLGKINAMFSFIFINYSLFLFIVLSFVILLMFIILKERKIDRKYIIDLFVFSNLFFLFSFVVHIPFNFTFRITLFFLPLLFLLSFKYLNYLFYKRKLFFTFLVLLIALNLAFSVKYHINQPGDNFYPTKLVYEKIDIVTGNQDMAHFINDYVQSNNITNYTIGYIGLSHNHLKFYLEKDIRSEVKGYFRYRRVGDSTLNDLKRFIEENEDKTLIIVINANALAERENLLYSKVFGEKYVTEANPRLSRYIMNDDSYKEIYISQDGYSKIYRRL